MSKAFVSVLIDTYNHERYIEKAIRSVLEQDFPASDREIVVVEDGSTDRTAEIVRGFEPHVRLVQKANGGQASAFNVGIAECTGEIVSFLDGDDWWAPGKLGRVAQVMREDSSIGLLGHGIFIVHMDGALQEDALHESATFQANSLVGAQLFRVRKSFLGTSRMTIRSEVLGAIGLVPAPIKVQADEYLFTLAAVLSRTCILAEPLTYYRMHDANLFQLSRQDPEASRNKQESLAALASSLSAELARLKIDRGARTAITDVVQAEADQVRLTSSGGSGWEVVKNEWTIYSALFPEASLPNKLLKAASLLPAIFVPARKFYAMRKRIVESRSYGRFRKRWFPAAKLSHVNTNWKTGS